MRKIFIELFMCTLFFVPLYPVLDGREAPILLDTNYTFSNYEWARGMVDFGFNEIRFDPNLKVILGLDVPLRKNIRITFSRGSTLRSEVTTIILEKPLYLPIEMGGGVHFKTLNGYQGIVYPSSSSSLPDVCVISGDVTIDGKNNKSIIYPGPPYTDLNVGPSLQPSFILDSTTASTLRLKNISYATTSDRDKPFITGLNPGIRHKVILENVTFFTRAPGYILSEANMTFTNVDVEIGRGVTTFAGRRGDNINFYGGLKISDFGVLTMAAGVNINLMPTITGDDYFDIAPYGTLLLNDCTLTFTRALSLPATLSGQNTYSKLIADGRCVLKALNVGDDAMVTIGLGPQLTYTYDALIDIHPFSSLELQGVQMVNKNFVL